MKGLLLALMVLLVAAACGSSGKDLAEPTGQSVPEDQAVDEVADVAQYPPNNPTELAEFLDPLVEPLGLRFTRGSLNDTASGGYEPSDTGNHLALYVEPIDEYSDEDYIEGLYTVSAAVTPAVFENWAGLTSYDICQEPRPEDNNSPTPPPATQINIEREAAESFDWANGDLESMLQHAFDLGGESFSIVVGPPFDSVPRFVALTEQIFGG